LGRLRNILRKTYTGGQRGLRTAAISVVASLSIVGLTGCLKHTRILEKPQLPTVVLSVSSQQLIEALDQRYDSIHSLNATVLIRASVGGASKGKVTDYTSIHGYILLRQPDMLRVLGLLPVVDTRAFDMASNGKTFTLLIPHYNEAFVGSGAVTTPAANPLMNLRPAVFYDSLLVGKVSPTDLIYVTSDTRIAPIPHSKHFVEEPDYELGILLRIDDTQRLLPERVIHISRTNLLPYQQDEYDRKGILVTKTLYSNYQTVDQISYPMHIVINRPIDGYKLDLTIEKLTLNHPLNNEQFRLKIPTGTKIKHLP
jgi:outer membrane lipoprotein-sorting protein